MLTRRKYREWLAIIKVALEIIQDILNIIR